MPAANRTLPDGIEVFRAGRRTADNGQVYEITRAHLVRAAAAYDPKKHEAPLTVGHPESNRPAYGWVAGLQVDGDVLRTSHRQVEPQFAEMVADGRFKKRSASFYAPDDEGNPVPGTWYLRHLAFLGAQPPAVKGLKDIEFSEAAGAVNFSDPVTPPSQELPTMTTKTAEQLQAELEAEKQARAKADADAAAATARANQAEAATANFAEQAKQQRHAAHVSFCEGQVKAGKLLPKDQAAAVAVLDKLATSEVVEFSEGDTTKKVTPVAFVMGLIEGAKPKVDFSEHAGGNPAAARGTAAGKTDAEIDAAAQKYMRENKGVSYAEAARAVTFTD